MNREDADKALKVIDAALLGMQLVADFRARADRIERVMNSARFEGRDVTPAEVLEARDLATDAREELVAAIAGAAGLAQG